MMPEPETFAAVCAVGAVESPAEANPMATGWCTGADGCSDPDD